MAASTEELGDALEERAPRAGLLRGTWDSAVTSYYLIVGAMAMLVTLGLVMVLSSSSIYSLSIVTEGSSPYAIFLNHGRFALLGLPLAWLASRLPVSLYRRIAWPALLGALFLQALVPFFGKTVNGNKNWLVIGGQSLQPSELAKLALAVWLAAVLARKRHLLQSWLHVAVPALLGAGAILALVLVGHDLGTAIILILLVAGSLWVAGVPVRIMAGAAAAVGVAVVLLAQSKSSRITRIQTFFSDDCDKLDECLQTTRGLYGLGSGGWTGVGLGESREKWLYLPEAHNDFIFAILGEELGLMGTLLVLALFGVLAVAMTRIVRRHPDPFVQIATAGIGAWILGQALVNIAVVIGLLPVVGVPLPLLSAGGSALITTMLALGVVLAFARSEPGAHEALTARAGVVRRSLAVVGRPGRGERSGRTPRTAGDGAGARRLVRGARR